MYTHKQKTFFKLINLSLSLLLSLSSLNLGIIKTEKTLALANTFITGAVTHGGNPIPGMEVSAYDGSCSGNFLGTTYTDTGGNYSLENMPAGNVYVKTNGLEAKWWDGSNNGTTNCNSATGSLVSSGATTSNIDFAYPLGGNITGHVVDANGANVNNLKLKVYA